jgi:hypothetical protein
MDHAQGKEFVLTDYAKNLIKFKARQLSQRQDFQSAEPEDLQQELWLALVKRPSSSIRRRRHSTPSSTAW